MYYGDFAEDDTVQIIFNTFTSDDPSASCTITNLVAGDIKIHKDGAVAEKASSDGVTVTINFDGITGNHLVSIDTSDDTGAAGFWVTGSEYQVRMEGTTVDGATINAWIGAFSIERAGGVLALLKAGTVDVNTKTITNGIIIGDTLAASACTKIIDDFETQSQADPTGFHVNVKEVNGTAQTANDNGADINDILTDTAELGAAVGASISADIAAIKAETALIVADTNELQTDNIPGTLATIAGYLDTEIGAIVAAVITNAAGADIAADIIALKAETALIVADTNELQTDDIPGKIAALNNLSAANVNAEVVDALNVDTYAEPGQEAPTATTTLVDKIGYLYKFLRNKITDDGTNIKVYNDAGAVVDQKSGVSEAAGTVTRGEFGTGP